MPSTFTNNGGIELPADGEKDGVWGDVVNLNMQIVDRLTNGVGAVSLSGTTSTLVTSDGSLDGDGQYKVIVFGGSPSGTHTVTIQPDDAQKVYFVKNETAEDVIMTQGSGGNATITAGSGAIVYANGAGTGAAVADLTATFVPDLTLAGVTASAAELNLLDGVPLTTDLSYVDGVTSAIQTQIDDKQTQIDDKQTQIDGKQATITGAATTITGDDLAVSRALVSDGSGKVAVSDVTAAELAVLDGITTSTAELNLLDGVPLTTDLSYVDGVTSAIQTQLNGKEPADAEILKADTDDNLTAGYTSTADNEGTQSSGTYTPAPAGGNLKRIVNGGAFTLAAPTATGDYTMILQMTNNASAGVITTSGFTKETGAVFTTTDGDDYMLYIVKLNGFTTLHVEALQYL